MTLKQILDFVVKLNAKQARQAQRLLDAHLRDLQGVAHVTPDEPWRPATAHLPTQEDDRLGHFDYPDEGHVGHGEGAELQAGLEEAVRREHGL